MATPETTPNKLPPGKRNQRRARRQTPKTNTRVLAYKNALGLGRNIGESVLDVSETGVRLLLRQELRVGQEFEIVLESLGAGGVKLLAKVVWAVPTSDGKFVVGAHFEKSLSYAKLQYLARM